MFLLLFFVFTAIQSLRSWQWMKPFFRALACSHGVWLSEQCRTFLIAYNRVHLWSTFSVVCSFWPHWHVGEGTNFSFRYICCLICYDQCATSPDWEMFKALNWRYWLRWKIKKLKSWITEIPEVLYIISLVNIFLMRDAQLTCNFRHT